MREFVLQADFEKAFNIPAEAGNTVRADQVFNNFLIEYKVLIKETGAVAAQMARYVQALEHKGEFIPRLLLAVSLSNGRAWIYSTPSVIAGAGEPQEFNLEIEGDAQQLMDMLHEPRGEGVRYNVSPRNITALARKFYEAAPDAGKDDFMEGADSEIRRPAVLKDRILSYKKADNTEFSGVADTLNPKLWQKELGAFFTPPHAVIAGQSLLMEALESYKDCDYAVIDRCAGTGNLYRGLPDEVLEHCYLSELEPVQRQILELAFQDTGAHILPAPHDGLSSVLPPHKGLEARIKAGAKVVVFENPPYVEAGAGNERGEKRENTFKKQTITLAAKKELKGAASNDICNIFIWSAFKAVKADKVIVFAPIKYWKAAKIAEPHFNKGFIVNRQGFHASQGAITIISWDNISDTDCNEISLGVYDMPYGNAGLGNDEADYRQAALDYPSLQFVKVERVNPVCELPSASFEQLSGKTSLIPDSCLRNGLLDTKKTASSMRKSVFNSEMLGYARYDACNFSPFYGSLTRLALFTGGSGSYLTKSNASYLLPYFVTCHRKPAHWWEIDLLMRAYADQAYREDDEFLTACMAWTAFSPKNKTRALTLSDGTFVQNEMTPDARGWLGGRIINNKFYTALKSQYDAIYAYCRDVCKEPFDARAYQSVWEMKDSFDITRERADRVKEVVYPELRTKFKALKAMTDALYAEQIEPKLFKYGFIK